MMFKCLSEAGGSRRVFVKKILFLLFLLHAAESSAYKIYMNRISGPAHVLHYLHTVGTRNGEPFDGVTTCQAAATKSSILTYYGGYSVHIRVYGMNPDGTEQLITTYDNDSMSHYGDTNLYYDWIPAYTGPDTDDPQPEDANTDEPINFISGNNHFAGFGLTIPAPGIPLAFNLYYNSVETNRLSAGPGWRHSYEWEVTAASNCATICSGNARRFTFSRDTNGVYSASVDNNWRLTERTNGEHTLFLPEGRMYRFDTDGVLTEISDEWGNAVSLSYSNGLLRSAEHSNGRALQFFYADGLLCAVTAAPGLGLSFRYDPDGVLTQAIRHTGPEQYSEQYDYNAAFLLTQKVDAAGSDYHYTYGATNGRATEMYLTGSRWYEHAVEYSNSLSRVIYTRNGENLTNDCKYNNYTRRVREKKAGGEITTLEYRSASGDVTHKTVTSTDTGRWTQVYRLYDGRHNVTNEAFGLSAAPTNITKYAWHPQWQTLTSVTDPEGFRAEYEYIHGSLARERLYLSGSETAETAYSYNTNGLLAAMTNANSHSLTFTYNALGYPEAVVPQAGPVTTFGYDDLGHLTNCALPGGREMKYTVNPLGWIERIDYADGFYETYQYDGLGNVTNYVDRTGRATRCTYAPGGSLMAIRRQFGETNVTVSCVYDQQFYTLSIQDELSRPVEGYSLDALSRPVAVTNLEGQVMFIRYLVGGFVDFITRFDGTVVSNQYNGDGRLAAVCYFDQTNRCTYLRNGLVRTLEDSGSIISNDWNPASWRTQTVCVAASLTSAVNYAYDPVGNVTNSVVDFGGAHSLATAYQYDEAERLTEISTAEDTQRFLYAYHPDNGLVSSVSNAHLRAEYEYDILDRTTRINWKDSRGATVLDLNYRYNAAGMITSRVTVIGSQRADVSYQYDDLDRLVSAGEVSSLVEYSYDAAGNRQTKICGDYSVCYSLGAGNRLASWSAASTNDFANLRVLRVEGHASEPIGTDERWGRLWVSNRIAVTPEFSGAGFWIDAFTVGLGTQQVVAAIRDQAGNMGCATNQIFLTVVTNAQYGYNAAGCVTGIAYSGSGYENSRTLVWNSQYQVLSVSSASSEVNYSYDVVGRRIRRTEGTNIEQYVYDGDQVVADLDGNGNLLRTYVWGPGIDDLLALTVYGAAGTNTYYPLKDHQNSVIALADTNGTAVESYDYDAWGRVLHVKDASGSLTVNQQSAIGNRYLWQGREYDWTAGFYYFRARWYDPVAGRWLSKDPAGISGGLNQYAAFANNPVNCTDPHGLVVTIATRPILGGAGNHSFIDVTDSLGVTLYSGVNERGMKNDLGVRRNYLPDIHAKINSRVLIPPLPGMTQAQWDAAVRSSGEAALRRHRKRTYDWTGGDRGKTSGNCHVVTREIIEGAGGRIPAGYDPPGRNPGLHK